MTRKGLIARIGRIRYLAAAAVLLAAAGGLAAAIPAAQAAGAVTFDAAGGGKCADCTFLAWSHTVSGTGTALLAGIGVGIRGDSGCIASVSYREMPVSSANVIRIRA